MYMYMFSITICAGEGCSATTMAVACLEQRNIPLVIAFNVVWSPWGLGRTSPFRFAPRPRRHSWGGFTTYAHFSRQGEEEKFRNKTVVAHLFNSADKRQHRHLRKQNKQRHRRKKRTEKRERNAQNGRTDSTEAMLRVEAEEFIPSNTIRAEAEEFIPRNTLRVEAEEFIPSNTLGLFTPYWQFGLQCEFCFIHTAFSGIVLCTCM